MLKKCRLLQVAVLLAGFMLIFSCKQDPLKIAGDLIAEKQYDLALSQYDEAIRLDPENFTSIIDSCYSKSFELLNNGLRSESEKLFLYACNKLQSRYYPFTDSFHQYLKLINDKDSVFNLLLKVYPDYSNDELKYIVSSIELPDSKYDTAYILTIKDGYTDELWLFPNGGEDYNAKQFGLSTFNPIIYNAITRLSDSEIESIPSAAIIRSVKEDELFLQESLTTGLRISGIPELSNQFSLLRDKDDFSIAAEKDKLIKEILKLKKNYLLAGLKYMYSRYVIDGKCFIEKENYDFNAQHINVHLSISAWPDGGIYVATMRVPLSLEDAQTLFAENESFWVTVQYKVSPGVTIQNLGISVS